MFASTACRAKARPQLLAMALIACIAWPLALCDIAIAAPAAESADREHLNIDVDTVNKPWKGDLDAMIQRQTIRVLVVPSKTFYFVDKGVQRGATYDFVRQFEIDLNKKLAAQKKLNHKHLKVRVFFVPVGRES